MGLIFMILTKYLSSVTLVVNLLILPTIIVLLSIKKREERRMQWVQLKFEKGFPFSTL